MATLSGAIGAAMAALSETRELMDRCDENAVQAIGAQAMAEFEAAAHRLAMAAMDVQWAASEEIARVRSTITAAIEAEEVAP